MVAAKAKAPTITSFENTFYGETCEDEDDEQKTSSLGSSYVEQPYKLLRIFILLSMLHDDHCRRPLILMLCNAFINGMKPFAYI